MNPSRGLAAILASLAACAQPEPPTAERELYPIASSDAGRTRYEFGPGSLATTNNRAWGGADSVLYPALFDSDAGLVELEVRGLDLSGIDYTGEMGWPPESDDSGAQVWASLMGSNVVSYRTWSSLAGLLDPTVSGDRVTLPPADLRAYQFLGFLGDAGVGGFHRLRLERRAPAGARRPYETVDLRLRYEGGFVAAWVRLHASREWDEEGRESGAACPWNIAINNAIPGTADEVWTGECRALEPGATGRAAGAWIPVEGGAWTVEESLGPVQVGLSILNWENARGPYPVRWENVIVTGTPAQIVPSASGTGLLRAFGTGGSKVEPRGEWAEFSYRAIGGGRGARAVSLLHFESPGLQLESQETEWVQIERDVVRFAGAARVNGEGGFRYELRGAGALGTAPDSLSLQVWGPESSVRPYYEAFGSLTEGALEAQAPPEG